jgi:2-polyprenyl-3-methyl-5-hydroxy-6-metoxy-1,4-benzoquinol methylase
MATATLSKPREERWKEEAAFFDELAQKTDESALPMDPLALQRYTRPRLRRRFNKEFRLRLMGDLRGRSVLDVGCGDGVNSVLLARLGARVTGVDISPGSIGIARRRAEVNGVAGRVTLQAAPIEAADLPDDAFDLVWADAILHHVLDDLTLVMQRLVRCTRPGGLIVFSEPVNLVPLMRRIRQRIPVKTDGTPGERPLVRAEVDLVRRHLDGFQARHYLLFGRLDRFILDAYNYERTPLLRRSLMNAIEMFDYALLSLPRVRELGGACVMYGRPRKAVLRAA